MTQLGICINAKDAVPDAAECAALGLGSGDWVRTNLDGPLSLLDGMLAKIPADLSVMLTLNNQCHEVGWDWSGWEMACRIVAANYRARVKIVGCGNELDLWHLQPPVGNPDPRLTSLFAANLVRRASPILRAGGIKVAMTSVASGSWPAYLEEMSHLSGAFADYADLHLYAKQINGVPGGWQTAEDALRDAERLAGRPVICSEAGIKIDDAGGLDQQAQWASGLGSLPAELVCSWCWHDKMASPGETGGQAFGARGLDGKQKPLWFALQKLFRATSSGPPTNQHATFQHGFKQIADRHPDIVGTPRENESGPWRHASLQRTSNGWLVWGNYADGVGDQKGFVADDLTRWVWNGHQLERR